MTLNLNDINFKGSDVVKIAVYLVLAVAGYFSIKSEIKENRAFTSVSRQVTEMQMDGKDDRKETSVSSLHMQNQVNTNTQQILLLRQEIELFKEELDRIRANQ